MSSGIYIIQEEGSLLEMEEKGYDSEDVLQTLLATYPSIIPGSQIDSASPRRWLLIAREVAIPGEEDGGGRWSLDHLLIDQDAVPTLVEVKRSQDTRVRREVVGQMLEYAANASSYWSVDSIRARLEATCESRNVDAGRVLTEFLAGETETADFWQALEANLKSGRLRLVFVADSIPTELEVIVEFLNSQMDRTDVLAVEVKQYAQGDMTTLVSRVIGQAAAKKRAGTEGRVWDRASFMEELGRRHGSDVVRPAEGILAWAEQRMSRLWWGQGARSGSMIPVLDVGGTSHWLAAVWTYGRVEMQFQWMAKRPPFDDAGLRLEAIRRLNQIPGVSVPEDAVDRRPAFPLSALVDETSLAQFLDVLNWCVSRIMTG